MSVLSGQSYLFIITEFDCEDYLRSFYASFKGNAMKRVEPSSKCVVFTQSNYSCKWNNKTISYRLLEFGGGPVITSLINAMPYVNQITFAAYTKNERKEIILWKNREEGAHD